MSKTVMNEKMGGEEDQSSVEEAVSQWGLLQLLDPMQCWQL
jgi:hypothetical protein